MTIPVGQMTHGQMKQTLKSLTAKAGLEYSEIVGAFAKRRSKIANELLAINRESKSATFRCGTNPHFVACIVDEKETINGRR